MKNKSLQRIWITGASSGIGRALALKLALQGNIVVASGRNNDALVKLVSDFQSTGAESGGKIIAAPFDVTEESQAPAVKAFIEERVGRLNLCVICAGHCEYIEQANLSSDIFRRVFDTNLFGAVNTANIAIPLLSAAATAGGSNEDDSARSHLVVVSSLTTVIGFPRAEAYGASKAALTYLFNSLRVDVAGRAIDVSVINPGFVQTPMTDRNDFFMPFIISAEQAAERIINALPRRPLTYNFPKRLWLVLRLISFFPSLWYRLIGPRLSRVNIGESRVEYDEASDK